MIITIWKDKTRRKTIGKEEMEKEEEKEEEKDGEGKRWCMMLMIKTEQTESLSSVSIYSADGRPNNSVITLTC